MTQERHRIFFVLFEHSIRSRLSGFPGRFIQSFGILLGFHLHSSELTWVNESFHLHPFCFEALLEALAQLRGCPLTPDKDS
jgi:hypothetical protein